MDYLKIPGVEKPVSRLVMGSIMLDPDNMDYTTTLLDKYASLGGNCIDMAFVYGSGRAESAVGKWIKLKGNRESIIILDKGAHTPNCTVDGINREMAINLERLQIDCIDLWMLHRDNPELPVEKFIDCLNEHIHRMNSIE